MSTIFALAGLNASDYAYTISADRALLYDAVAMYMQMHEEALTLSSALFVQPTSTTISSERYRLPMTGRMQEARPGVAAAVKKAVGSWDVQYPLKHFSDFVAGTHVDLAYLTPSEFQAHIDGIMTRYVGTKRWEILYSLLNNTNKTFEDDRLGTLTVKPLANGDSVVYPPKLGSDTEATENHYLVSGYTSASISDTNNPAATITNHLVHHFGRMTGGSDIVVCIHPDEQAKIESLAAFVAVTDTRVSLNDTAANLADVPANVPGEVIGRLSGATVAVWDFVPSGYLMGVHRGVAAPLKQRIDPPETGLGNGNLRNLDPITRVDEITFNRWEARFGMGVANRLNGVVMQLKASGSYDIPSDYA